MSFRRIRCSRRNSPACRGVARAPLPGSTRRVTNKVRHHSSATATCTMGRQSVDAPYWRRLRQAFLRYVDAGDRIACLIIQEVMLESFAVSMYHAVADEAHEEMAKVFRAIGDEEEGHVDHAIGELQDALAANS